MKAGGTPKNATLSTRSPSYVVIAPSDAPSATPSNASHRKEVAARGVDHLQHVPPLLSCSTPHLLVEPAFSIAITAWAAKFCNKDDLPVGEGTNLLAIYRNHSNCNAALEKNYGEDSAKPPSSTRALA